MDIDEIQQLVNILKSAKISELAVSVGDAKVRLRKPLPTEAASSRPAIVKEIETPEVEPARAVEPAPSEVYVTAPMVGVFHSIDSISTAGTAVKAGQVMGAIESMKLMNDVVSKHDGVISEILIEDGMPVEYGQHLFKLEQT